MERSRARAICDEIMTRALSDQAFRDELKKDPQAILNSYGVANDEVDSVVFAQSIPDAYENEVSGYTYTVSFLTCCCVRTSCCIVYGGGNSGNPSNL
jgi:hypothetical protein